MGSIRRAWPLWTALGAHAAIAGALWKPHATARIPTSVEPETSIVIEDEPPQPESPDVPSQTFGHEREPTSPAALAEAFVPVRVAPPLASSSSAPEAPEAPAPSDTTWSFSPTAPQDLAIGTYWKSVVEASSAARPTPSTDELARNGDFHRRLSDDMRARDVATGHSIAGPLVSAAREAASPRLAPDVGTVTIEIDADASGEIVAARVVDASSDRAQWEDVAREIRRSMAHRRLRVPAGAHGVRAHVRIVAQRTLPGGEGTEVHPGAAPDGVCEGSGPTRRCTAGMPGAGGTWGDLSNIGAKRARVLHVQLLDEALL